MAGVSATGEQALVTPDWVESRIGDAMVRVIEIAGIGQDDMQAYKEGHVPGAACWEWKDLLWDAHARDFPAPDEFARRLGALGIAPDTTVVFYGDPVQFGIYGWWTFRYCGHRNVKVLDGGRHRWKAEGRKLNSDVPQVHRPVSYPPAQRDEAMHLDRKSTRLNSSH